LLGVGYSPARVVAIASAAAVVTEAAIDESDLASDARQLIARITSALGVDGRIDVREDDETVAVTCWPADAGLLIGRHGQTIDAIQYLMNAIAHRRGDELRKEVIVDAAGYRDRRRATLEALAVRSAEQAASSRRPVELEPMTAVERKVVHLALKERGDVETRSEGTEPNRYVVVVPAE
jgi:spoIIIJ-associated protein